MLTDHLIAYARAIRMARQAHAAVTEPGLAPHFQRLVQAIFDEEPTLPDLTVVGEFDNPGIGRPDIALLRPGQPARAFIELKALDKSANHERWTGHDRRQAKRFSALRAWATCNFRDFRLIENGEFVDGATIVPAGALDPARSAASADRLVREHDGEPFRLLLLRLARTAPPTAENAAQVAANLANAARLVRAIVADRLGQPLPADHALSAVRNDFRNVLYAHPEAGGYPDHDFDKLFSAAFAQTLAFGLLLVREASDQDVDANAWQLMPPEHPLMRTTLHVLSLPQVAADIGIGFEVMLDTVNSVDRTLLVAEPGGRDPILYFYEDFLRVFDPDARDRFGVYYTPVEVVRFMVHALDRALRDRLGTRGLRDPAVAILDPATGTGTFLLAIAQFVRDETRIASGDVAAAMALRQLAARMFGFELLVGPYAVAHYRLHHALRETVPAGQPAPAPLGRLGVYLTDTLAPPSAAMPPLELGAILGDGLREERREANRIKGEQPILAIIGNPPYRRLKKGEVDQLVGRFIGGPEGLWEDFKQPVRDAGWARELKSFQDLSIAFWRWSIWKMFESPGAPQRGVVAFITNRTFLAGKPYAGMRQVLRERFDHLHTIDLRGDQRRGERAGIEGDQGVFAIQVGTAITIAIADGSKQPGTLARVTRADAWANDHVRRRQKLDWLTSHTSTGVVPPDHEVERGTLDDFKPTPFPDQPWPTLRDCFVFTKSGVKTQNDDALVSVDRADLVARVAPLIANRDDPSYDGSLERAYAYRPLDDRWLFNDPQLVKRHGPDLQAAWGAENVALYAMAYGPGAGPAVWCHGLLPDYHSFRGSFGGYAFPLYDRRAGTEATNVSPALIEGLSLHYGRDVRGDEAFDAVLGLLSASDYTLRFAEDLEDVFARIPFPAAVDCFEAAAFVGRKIRALETRQRPPSPDHMPPELARMETWPSGPLGRVKRDGSVLILCDDGSGRMSGIPDAVWTFSVSGYRVFQQWLAARAGRIVDLDFIEAVCDQAGRIIELTALFEQASPILRDAVAAPLTREALGLTTAASDVDGDDEDEE